MMNRLRTYLHGAPAAPILVLFALNVVDELDSHAFNLLGPEIAKDFGVGVGVFGTITLLVTLLVPLVSVPVAYLADRHRRMPIAMIGAATWASFAIGTGLAPALWVLVVVRAGSGFGKVVNEPVHGALIADFYPPEARAKAFGLHSIANPVGQFVASIGAGFLAQAFGWRIPFMLMAIPTVLVLAAASSIAEPPRGIHEVEEVGDAPPLRITARRLWAIRSLRFQWIGLAFTGGSTLGIGVLIPFFLEEEFGVEPALRGIILGIGTALSAAAILFGIGIVQRRLDASPSDGLRFLVRIGASAGIGLFAVSLAPSLWLTTVLIWYIVIVLAFVTPGLRTITTLVAPPEIRASAFALGGLVALSGAGFALLGFAVGSLVSVRAAIAAMAPIFLRGIGNFMHAAKFLDDDIERLRHPGAITTIDAPIGEEGEPPLLAVRRLTVSYGPVRVLFGIDLDVGEREIVALLGTNGAGKSTALNAITGLIEADGGNVWFAGDPIIGEPTEAIVERGIVQVPGGRGVFPGLTVAENLRMGAFLLHRQPDLSRSRIDDALDLFPRLRERLEQRAGSLSGGERQMLTLAQSFLLRPRLLLIDELSLGLAPTVVQELLVAVRAMNDAGTAMILVEQSVNVALTLAHRAYFLEKGEVRFSGPTAQLLERPDLLRSVFLEGASTGLAKHDDRDRT